MASFINQIICGKTVKNVQIDPETTEIKTETAHREGVNEIVCE